ncbi:MAG: DUF4870 domain-containing protein [Microbacterium pygmaeum]
MSAPAPAADQSAPLSPSEERTWTWMAHLSGLFAFVGPLVVWLVQKDKSPVVSREAKEALNFQITVAAITLAVFIAGTILSIAVIGLFVLMIAPLVPLYGVVFAIVAAVKSNQTGTFRYPLTVRLVK